MAEKMVDITVKETSGVDHPAHLRPGWLVMKASDLTKTQEGAMTTLADRLAALPEDDDLRKAIEAEIEAKDATISEHATKIEDLEKSVADLTTAVEKATKAGDGEDTEEAALAKAMGDLPEPVRKAIEKSQADAAAAVAKAQETEATLAKERGERADEAKTALVKSMEHLTIDAAEVGPMLARLEAADPALAKAVETTLAAANGQVESAGIFQEIGTANAATAGDAYGKIQAAAKALKATDPSLTDQQAFAKAAANNPSLYDEYVAEKKG